MRSKLFLAAVLFSAGIVMVQPASAQQLTAEQVLARAYERYAGISDFQATVKTGLDMGGMKLTQPAEFAYRRPDHLYLSLTGMVAVSTVQKGDTRCTYMGMLNQYTQEKVKSGELSTSEFSMFGVAGGGVTALQLLSGRPLVDRLSRPKLLPEAEVQGRPCYVVGLPLSMPMEEAKGDAALHFDKENMTLLAVEASVSVPGMPGPLAGMKMLMRETYEDIKIDQGVPDERFAFEPPKGAKLVTEFGPPESEKPKLIGKRAPDFKATNLSGKTVSLADFKGRVLLLDFWATWCPPCKKEMPDIQRIHEQAKGKSLAVLAISQDEDVKDVKEFLRERKLTLPAAMDDGSVGQAYGVEAIPTTFVIDEGGVVRVAFRGLTSGARLAEEISKLGVKIEMPSEATAEEPAESEAARAHREAGLKMFLLGRDDDAEKELRAAAEAAPDSADGWLTLGEFYLKASRAQDAATAFDHALKAADESKHAVEGSVAKAYLDVGADYDAALEHARGAVRLEPKVAAYWSTLGWACYHKGMYEQAVFNLKKALKLEPQNPEAHYRLGAVYEKQGEKSLARMQYNEAVKFDPSLEEARQALDRVK